MAAENQDGQEKTEEATPTRLKKMRDEGQVPRSQELKTMAMTLMGAALIFLLGSHFADGLFTIYTDSFSLSKADTEVPEAVFIHLSKATDDTLWMMAPYFAAMIITAIFANTLLGGFVISRKKIKPKFSNMSPIKGVKRMFGKDGLVNLLKSVLKAVLVGGATTLLLMYYLADFVQLSKIDVEAAVVKMLTMLGWFSLLVSLTLVIIALIDVPYQLFKFKRDSKMTKQEVKDDRKQTEGSDQTKARVRQVQLQMAQQRMMEEVPKADVIITNPTHFAVALRYDEDDMSAPIVVAKGADLIAKHIRDIAEHNRVTMVEAPMLARAIYFTTDLNQPIPVGLYLAVAKLLAYVYQVQASPFDIRDDDQVRDQWQVPEDMQYDESGRKLS